MAYDSFPWNGTTLGHAATTTLWSAPYSSSEYSDVYAKLLTSYDTDGYVVPLSYTPVGGLPVSANSPAAMNVLVSRGAIYIFGRICESTATETLTISTADATNPRIDRIVARLNITAQTWELAVLAGTPAATPAMPTLTQNATTFEISIAYVWVAAGATTITNTYIHDERLFLPNFEAMSRYAFQDNLILNSEFMGFSKLTTGTIMDAPDGWDMVGTVTSYASETKPSQMSRGRAVKITAGADGAGLSQTVRVKPSTVYVIKGLIRVTAGDVGAIVVTTDSAAPVTMSRQVHRTGTWIEYTLFYATESDATSLTLQLLANTNTDVIDYGQWIITEGFIPGPFRQIHETIYFKAGVTDSNWDADTKSTGTTALDLDTDFQGLILPGTHAVILHTFIQDSGAAGATINTRTAATASALAYIGSGGLSTNAVARGMMVAPLEDNQFAVAVVATGAGTATITLRVLGIVT